MNIVIASLLREDGATGLQTHAATFKQYLRAHAEPVEFITPMSFSRPLALPILGVGRVLIEKVDRRLGAWWHRYWRGVLVRAALRRRLRRGDEVVIYAQCPVVAGAALAARSTARQPERCRVVLVTHFNGSDAVDWTLSGAIKEGDWVYRGIRRLEARVLPRVDGIVYVSSFVRASVEREIPAVVGVPSVVLPNFVFPPPAAATDGATRADLVAVGTLEGRKNQGYLLRVLDEARARGHQYTLTVIGEGPDRARLVDLARELGLQEQVRFLGRQPGAAGLLAGHRALAHAALVESFGMVLIEAMAAGLPVLAAPTGGIPDVFADGVEGLYWPLDDAGAAAERMIALLEDAALYARCASAATHRFKTQFAPDVVGERLLGFVRAGQPLGLAATAPG